MRPDVVVLLGVVVVAIGSMPIYAATSVSRADPLDVEHDENEFRKPFTLSERHAIAEAMKARIGDRQGERSDIEPAEVPDDDEPVVSGPQVDAGERTRDVVAAEREF